VDGIDFSQSTSIQLLKAHQAGEPRALDQLLKRIGPRILLSVRSRRPAYLRNKFDSMDVLQEVLKDALPRLKTLEITSEGGLIHWFSTLIANQIADQMDYLHADKRSISKETSLDGLLEESEEDGPTFQPRSSDRTPSGELVVTEQVRSLENAIDRLPEEYQEVIRQRDIEGLGYDEIGQAMKRSANAARMLYNRALDRLTTEMAETVQA
jgi:RNA polymerase sigma-70 factor (subfamily 1)